MIYDLHRSTADPALCHGLAVIGVHALEFSFEKNIDNVRWAAKDMRIVYPIAIDSDHAIWRGFNTEYWPALYFADPKGKVRHRQFGEGEYEQSEKVIQQLLAETGASGIRSELVSVDASGAEAAADSLPVSESPEHSVASVREPSCATKTLALGTPGDKSK
jgi:hypothetical protein